MPLAGQFVESRTGINSYENRKSQKEFQEFVAAEEAKERKKLEQLVKPLTVLPADTCHAMRVHDFEMTELWSSPLAEIQAAMNRGKWESLYWLIHLREDSEPRVKQSQQDAFNAFEDYCAALKSRTGFLLNEDGKERLSKMVCVQLRCGGIEVTQETIDAALDCLLRNHCFSDGEVDYNVGWKTAATTVDSPPVTADVFEQLNLTGNEEESRIGKRIAQDLFAAEFRPTIVRFYESIWARYQYELSQTELAAIKNVMETRNLPRTFESLVYCKRVLIQNGILPSSLYTHEELKTIAIEALPTDDRESLRIVLHGTLDSLKALMVRKGITV